MQFTVRLDAGNLSVPIASFIAQEDVASFISTTIYSTERGRLVVSLTRGCRTDDIAAFDCAALTRGEYAGLIRATITNGITDAVTVSQ